ncbi:MAG: hypothetical protein KC486_03615 [Myxococcales bacterium]|nr:hypothetical protein [Myxococcales bacterium]
MRRLAALTFGLFLSAGIGACDGGDDGSSDDLGKPCNYDGDCSGDLVCDFHMALGTCQLAHGHSSTTGADSDSSSSG